MHKEINFQNSLFQKKETEDVQLQKNTGSIIHLKNAFWPEIC